VDQLYLYASQYLKNNNSSDSIDLAMLNLGGIRASMNAGKIKIETMYQIAPFDNYFVLVYIKGSELKKMYKKFTEKDMGILAHSQMVFQNGRIISYSIQGKPIQDEQVYILATIDFLSNGGDGYLENIKVEKVDFTGILIRDIYIQQIQKMTDSGRKVEGKMDQRVIIKPTP
jgi:2',3'-cyclic-nucleotide 2'-phosphodiesterase (5'-nucleotidase family)